MPYNMLAITKIMIWSVVGLLITYDVVAAIVSGNAATESVRMLKWARSPRWFWLATLWGGLTGHLFWPQLVPQSAWRIEGRILLATAALVLFTVTAQLWLSTGWNATAVAWLVRQATTPPGGPICNVLVGIFLGSLLVPQHVYGSWPNLENRP